MRIEQMDEFVSKSRMERGLYRSSKSERVAKKFKTDNKMEDRKKGREIIEGENSRFSG